MALFPNGGPRYEVHLSGLLARQFRDIQEQASLEGRGEASYGPFARLSTSLRMIRTASENLCTGCRP